MLLLLCSVREVKTTGRSRDPWFDNGRWLAGSLVVMVHANQSLLGQVPIVEWLHAAFLPARIPLFAILVGYFTRRVPGERDYSDLLRMIVVPFLVITSLHVGLNYWRDIQPAFSPVSAQYTLWFLFAVIFWRLTVPVFMRFRRPMLVAVVVSLVSGAFDALWVFSLRQTLGMLPFVILGVYLRRDDSWLRQRTGRSSLVACAIVSTWVVGITVAIHWGVYHTRVVGMWSSYDGGLHQLPEAMLTRLGVLVIVGGVALATLHLMPRRRIRWLTSIGAAGFTIYLLHGLVLRLLRYAGVVQRLPEQWWAAPVSILFSLGLAALLGSTPVRRLAEPLVRPRLGWLLRPDEEPARAEEPARSRA